MHTYIILTDKAQQGSHIYTYDNLNRMFTSNIAKTKTTYTYDTLGNLVYEKIKNKSVDYQYNELNQLVKRTDSQNQVYTYQYDKRGNRIAETGKKESRAFVYDETNHLVEGTNWKGDKSAYTYNALFVRINNIQTSHSGNVYDRDYVIDYTSIERDDLMIYAEGNGQLDYVQREVYAGSERIEQFTDRSNGGYERTLYVHEDVQGNTRYYTKTNGNSFAELTYDAWGMPVSPNKLLNNDHGNYVYATYTGHIFDTTLDIYFAEARFYDAQTRTWLAMDPIKDGGNWYQYCFSNPLKYWDPLGLAPNSGYFSQLSPCDKAESLRRSRLLAEYPEINITVDMLNLIGWKNGNSTSEDARAMQAALWYYGIKDKNSIQMFLATLLHESARGTDSIEGELVMTDAQWQKYINSLPFSIGYTKNGRGAGYIQITWEANQLAFLNSFLGVNAASKIADADRAKVIATEYPLQSAAWYWGKGLYANGNTLNDYVVEKMQENSGQDEVFLITQYYVNGWIANGGNDDLAAMRVGKAPYSIDPDKNILNVNGRSYKLPVGWSDRAKQYENVKQYVK